MPRSLFALLVLLLPTAADAQRPLLLVPQPREARAERDLPLTRGLDVIVPADSADAFAARDLRDGLREAGIPAPRAGVAASARIVLLRLGSASARASLPAPASPSPTRCAPRDT
jgi:hypothetical protein